MKARCLWFILACVVLAATPVWAITNVGTAGAQFLKIGPGARADSLGGAYSTIADDATAIYWNPAGLTQLETLSLSNTYVLWVGDTRFNFLAGAVPVGEVGTLAASITALMMPQMEITTLAKPDGTGQWFDAGDWAVSVAYARQLYDSEEGARLSVGINAKYIYQKIHRESAKGVALDVGTLYYPGWKSLRLGMCFSNFGPEMSFSGPDLETGSEEAGDPRFADYRPYPDTSNPTRDATLETTAYPLPINFRLGIAYDLVQQDDHLLTLALDGNHPNDNAERLNFGAEYWYKNAAALRAGYKVRLPGNIPDEVNAGEEEGLTLGLGLHLNLGESALILDYAFADFGRLKSAHRVSLGLRF